ncbi:hypothetical protein F3Y22_tig00110637pilonHSYRG00151 [Hibiscus syriacus]|uniref:Mitochondrial adenine nucleotide transporter ADNT1 n=1 Tax=Hibiscus syriacus TaxID=106335 RepID=A0A6A3A0P3_HIBSY|nr:hypothetical protein F3Y22_tig00110637pilonHSYRG00151 [Hibiscus syriacus]
MKVLQLTLPNVFMSALEVLEFVKARDCYPNVSIAYRILLTLPGNLYLYQQQTGNEDAQLTPLLRLGARACAGIIAMSATYPMDMVRGRLTVQTENSPYQYRGMFHAVLRQEGRRALYKGWLPSVIGVVS